MVVARGSDMGDMGGELRGARGRVGVGRPAGVRDHGGQRRARGRAGGQAVTRRCVGVRGGASRSSYAALGFFLSAQDGATTPAVDVYDVEHGPGVARGGAPRGLDFWTLLQALCVGGDPGPLGRPFNCKPLFCDSDWGGTVGASTQPRILGSDHAGSSPPWYQVLEEKGGGQTRKTENKISVLDQACRAARSLEGCSCPSDNTWLGIALARYLQAVRGPWGHRKPSSSISKHRDHRDNRHPTSRRERRKNAQRQRQSQSQTQTR